MFSYVSHVFSSCEKSSHLTKNTCHCGSSSEGPLAIIDSITQSSPSASISIISFLGSVSLYRWSKWILKIAWIFQESSNLSLQYRRLLPTDNISNSPSILSSNFLHLCFARMFRPLSKTYSSLFKGLITFLPLL